MPVLTTTIATAITTTTATIGGIVRSDGNATITERGICYSTTTSPTTASSKLVVTGTTGTFTCNIIDLIAGSTYYVRAYATNSVGTAYGNEVKYTTYKADAISDVDNNYYNIVTIGTQVWMVENLKTTKYRNGTDIPNITTAADWANQTAGAYCWYSNNISNKTTYGALYNWYAVMDSRNLCPTGWHVPTDTEWTTLTTHLGGSDFAGGQLKAIELWTNTNPVGTNSSGFTALPGGLRTYYDGMFDRIGNNGYWWSSTGFDKYDAWYRCLSYGYSGIIRYNNDKTNGKSIRCLRDL